jgi:hypothetical protein
LLFFAQLNFVIPAQAGSIPTPLHLDTVFQRYDGRCPSPGCLSGHDGFFDFASTTEQSFLVIVIFRAFLYPWDRSDRADFALTRLGG